MQSPTGPSRGLVVAAVCFDPQTDAVVKAATTLARRFDMEVRFVHVVEPIMMEPWVATMSPYYSYYPIDAEVEAESLKAKDAKLKELMAGIKPAVRMSATVISGMAGQALVAECIAKRANLLVTAYSPESYRLSNAGLSTALNLNARSPPTRAGGYRRFGPGLLESRFPHPRRRRFAGGDQPSRAQSI